jgi:predicted HTH transcriptional regulator
VAELVTESELREILNYGAEQRGVEFKAAGDLCDGNYRARVVRAVLGMANRRDGGRVILGVDDGDPANSVGVSQAQAESWTTFDDVADQISKYADPMVEFSSSQVQFDGNQFVVIDVDEFREVPVLCKREYQANGGS